MSGRRRIVEFDYIRVMAILCILLCHSCFEWGEGADGVGRYFALTFNFVFFMLSAVLFGLGWSGANRTSYSKDFLFKRIGKLSRTYYPYLIILFGFLYITCDYFSIRKMITHFLYLPWIDKITGYGHLWFMTLIAFAYAGIYACTKVQRNNKIYKVLIYSILIGGGYGVCRDGEVACSR